MALPRPSAVDRAVLVSRATRVAVRTTPVWRLEQRRCRRRRWWPLERWLVSAPPLRSVMAARADKISWPAHAQAVWRPEQLSSTRPSNAARWIAGNDSTSLQSEAAPDRPTALRPASSSLASERAADLLLRHDRCPALTAVRSQRRTLNISSCPAGGQ